MRPVNHKIRLVLHEVAKVFPALVTIKRYMLAAYDAILPMKRSYAQHEEDLFIQRFISAVDSESWIYMDVGANQPTRISNTYLFYRKGFHGVLMEPNHELMGLCRLFRKRDVFICAGAAEVAGIEEFKIGDSSVDAGFLDGENINRSTWVPMLSVDQVWKSAGKKRPVFLFSVDTEGYDLNVLSGAKEMLENTLLAVVETQVNYQPISDILMSCGFEKVADISCNSIWLNRGMNNSGLKF